MSNSVQFALKHSQAASQVNKCNQILKSAIKRHNCISLPFVGDFDFWNLPLFFVKYVSMFLNIQIFPLININI